MNRFAHLAILSATLFWLPLAALPQSQAAPSDQSIAPGTQATPQPVASPQTAVQDQASSKKKDRKENHKSIASANVHNPVLWQDPGDIANKDLFYGCGGQDGQPKPPFIFLDQDKHESNPKFDARDANGRKWRVKLGAEARPEIVASRLLWAVGYFTEDDYVLPEATVPGLRLHHTAGSVKNGDQVIDARFARKPDGEKRIASWRWKKNHFSGTREFNGLRVMMAVLNSWDLKSENNAVYSDKKTGQQLFLVSDTGASFGTNSIRIENVHGKGNVKKYVESKFITHESPTEISFGTPGPPNDLLMESGGMLAPLYVRHLLYDWIGRDIPRADARWIGSLLGQLSHQQLVDAFRAGHFTPKETDEYVTVLEDRIARLKAL
ncbi:MAG TPA: hypothetical protein VHY48_09515 [Acidobacteriaceae bacterium]|jgi:hypothetical protein|nr:hypothetical protein [Acidobacteriaceae bacterium]